MDVAVLAKQLGDKWAGRSRERQSVRDAKPAAKDEIPAAERRIAAETAKESASTAGGATDATNCGHCEGTGKASYSGAADRSADTFKPGDGAIAQGRPVTIVKRISDLRGEEAYEVKVDGRSGGTYEYFLLSKLQKR